jgi:antirestriction protein ArdC
MRVSGRIEDLALDTVVKIPLEDVDDLGIVSDPMPIDLSSIYPMVVAVDGNGQPVYAKDDDGNVITPESVLRALSKTCQPKLLARIKTRRLLPVPSGTGAGHQEGYNRMGDKAVVDVLIDEVASGSAPWQKQWQAGDLNKQYNPYGGVVFPAACQMTLLGAGYSDPRWLLPGQIEGAGLTLKPDAVGTPVFTMNNCVQTAGGNDVVKTDEPVVVQYMVFNAEQVVERDRDKIPKFEPDRNTRVMPPEERLAAIAENMGVRIKSAPDMQGSRSESQSGLIGELCRAAVAQCRGNSSGGDVAVATREAMAAMLLAQELGAGYQPPDGQSLRGWADVVRNDPRELYRAVKDAEQAKGFLMQFDVERQQRVVSNCLD